MHCIACGTALPEGAAFCPTCGALVEDEAEGSAQALTLPSSSSQADPSKPVPSTR